MKLLLHSCCGPCSTAVIERLLAETDYEIGVFYYNPNISPKEEYFHRKNEQIKFLEMLNSERVKFIDCDYIPDEFYDNVKGLECEREGGKRCTVCFKIRLNKTAMMAKSLGYDIFGTTLTVSPHKNAQLINEIGKSIAENLKINYLVADFKKRDGFKRSITLSKEFGLYRQNYCGCAFSMQKDDNKDKIN